MKPIVLFLILTFIYTVGFCQQRKYVDLTDCEGINNPITKPGWGDGTPVFFDEFQTKSYYNLFSSSGCWDPLTDKYIVIRSDHDWCWYGGFYGKHTEPEII